MGTVLMVTCLAALIAMERVGAALDRIVEDQLPETVETLLVARATDAVAATTFPLASITDQTERIVAFDRVDRAFGALEQSLAGLESTHIDVREIRTLTNVLAGDIDRLRILVDERISLLDARARARERLLLNRQLFQRTLRPRVRILEADGHTIQHLMTRRSQSHERVAHQALGMIPLIPAARFYGQTEAISGHLLAAGQDPTLTALAVSRSILSAMIDSAAELFQALSKEIADELAKPFQDLERLVLSDEGLPTLRERELITQQKSREAIGDIRNITQKIDSATKVLMDRGLTSIDDAGVLAAHLRNKSLVIVLLVTGLGLAAIAVLMRFHIGGHVLRRLTWLSEAMQEVAAGQYGTPLPPSGEDELGRLGAALSRFRTTAIDADTREAELRASKQKAETALAALRAAQTDLEKQARTDFLTGIANRQHFMWTAERICERAIRNGDPVALILMDIDHFKLVNDTHGHLAGDQALRAVALACQEVLRPNDGLGRLGGEEFAAILPNVPLPVALEAAEQVRLAVATLRLTAADGISFCLTISLGVADVCRPAQGGSAAPLDSALARADDALYAAKAAGRNRVHVAKSVVPEATLPIRGLKKGDTAPL